MTKFAFDGSAVDPQDNTVEDYEAARLVALARKALTDHVGPPLVWDTATAAAMRVVVTVLSELADTANRRDQDTVSTYHMIRVGNLIKSRLDRQP